MKMTFSLSAGLLLFVSLAVAQPATSPKKPAAGMAVHETSRSVAKSTLAISTLSPLAPGGLEQAYSLTLDATGGTPPYSFSVLSGALPSGLTLAAAGEITGTPSLAGIFNFTAQVSDSASSSATMAFDLTIFDETPDSFGFVPQTGVPLSTVRVSNAVTPTGIFGFAPVSVTGGEYSINCALPFTSTLGVYSAGQSVCVRHTSASTNAAAVTTALTIGNVSGSFTSTTAAPPATPGVRGDTNADGKADLFWRQAVPGPGISWWTMNGAASTGFAYHEVGSEWLIAFVADVDGDGKADIIWRRSTDGATYLWTLDGLAFKSFFDLGVLAPATWSLAGAADLNGDGKADLLWRNADGTLYGWIMNGGAIASQGVIGNPGPQWQVAGLADMNADGKADIVLRNTTDGGVSVYFMNGLSIASGGFAGTVDPSGWTLAAVADFNGDQKADLLWRSSAGETWVWLMNGATFVAGASIGNPGLSWTIRSVADFDGVGKSDIMWRHTDGTTSLWTMSGANVVSMLPIANPGGTWQIVAP